ncbi:MAG: ubiquitin-activating E1 FCCH domain-containing protein [Acidobacteriota bacterium]
MPSIKMIHLFVGMLFFLFLLGNPLVVSGAPLLPFTETEDLLVLDSGSGHLLRISPVGLVGVEIQKFEILALTGGVDVLYENKGIAIDAAGAIYFTAFTGSQGGFFGGDNRILKKTPAGVLSILTSQADLSAATGNPSADAEGITLGSDGFLYTIDDSSNALLRVDSHTGKVNVFVDSAAFDSVAGLTTVALKGGIVAGPGGILYVQSSGTPNAVLEISPQGTPSVLSSGDPFQALGEFMTRASNGDVLVVDKSPDVIHRINPAGGVGTFLSQAQLEAANGGAVTLRGGIAFDSAGNFYLAESDAGNLLRFDPSLNGTVWIPASVVVALTGVSPNFNGGIAFEPMPRTVLLANFTNGNNAVFNSRVYLFNSSTKAGNVAVRVFTLPLTGGLAQELTLTALDLGTLGAKSGRNIRLAEDILNPLGITTPYTTDGGNLTLEFTIQAAAVRGASQVFSFDFGFGTHPLQEIPSTPGASPTVLAANFSNGNNSAFNSRVYLWNPSTSAGEVTVRVFTLPLAGGLAQELTATPLPLGTLEARSALNIKLAEDILTPLGVLLPYTIDGGNLTLEFTIQAADVRGAAQVFSSDFAFGTYPLQEVPSTPSAGPTVLVANVTNGNSSVNDSRIYLWNPSTSAGEVTVRVFTLPVADGAVQDLAISSITQANPAVVTTSTDHGLVTGDEIRITGVFGMTQVNDREFVITVVDADEFSLNGEDSTGYTAYVIGGVVSLLGTKPLALGTLGARSALNIKLAEDILTPLGFALPYTRDDGNLTLEFTIQAADVKGAAQVFSSTFASGTYTLQAVPPIPTPGATRLTASFTNGNDGAFDSRISLFNPSLSGGDITVRVFTLPLSSGTAQELTITPLELGTLEARSALDIRLVEDILVPLEITTPYTTDGGNLILELTIQATDVQGTAQVFSSDFSLGTYPLQ